MTRPDPLPDDWYEVGDVLTRDGDDRWIVIATNEQSYPGTPPDLIDVECSVAPAGGWCDVGHKEFNVPRRFTLIERGGRRATPGSTPIYLPTP